MTEYPSGLQTVPCNLCGGDRVTPRYRLRRSSIVTCERCGFSFVSPRAPSATLQQRLQHWADEDVLDAERLRIAFNEGVQRLYGRYLARLEQKRRTGGRRLLDIGCSTGCFLDAARRSGWEVEGLELGRASAQYTREKLGLTVHGLSLYDYDAPAGSYDAICALEVLEHLEDPAGALARIARWLKPGGLFLASTPNFDSLFRRLHGSHWWVVNCEDEHIVFFAPATLRDLLRRQGFDVVSERIRGCDVIGLLRMFGSARNTSAQPVERSSEESRDETERVRSMLRTFGVLPVARAGVALMESAFSGRRSPLYGLGEQLVFVAVLRQK